MKLIAISRGQPFGGHMRKIALIAAFAAVSACSQADVEPEAEATEEVATETAEPVALDGKPSAGSYTVTAADGTSITQEVRADGTFLNTAGEDTEGGTWEQKSPEVFCTTSDVEGAEQQCSSEAMSEDAVWQSVDSDGNISVVERIEAE